MAAKTKVNAKTNLIDSTLLANTHLTIAQLVVLLPNVSPLVLRQEAKVLGVVISPTPKKISRPRQ